METIHITTSKEGFNEANRIKSNILWVRNYNYYLVIQLVKDGYLQGRPKKYTFETLNVFDFFFKMISNC